MNNDTTNAIYDSCKNVFAPSFGQDAIILLCGPYGKNCNPHRLFDYFGDNPLTPFPLNYKYMNTSGFHVQNVFNKTVEINPYNTSTVPCNGNEENMDKACLCSDCREACIKVEVSGLPDTCPQMVGPFQLVTLVLLIVFLVELIVIPVCFYCAQRSKHDGPEKGKDENIAGSKRAELLKPSFTEKSSAKFGIYLQNSFSKYAKGIIRRPITVFVLSIIFCAVLIYGVRYIKVTTDPVELWASPTSRTRIEKDYYDERFEPFYRTTQVIMKPSEEHYPFYNFTREENVDQSGKIKKNVTDLFGQALHKSVFLEMMKLAMTIQNITAMYEDEVVHLSDVCFAPMKPRSNDCAMMAVSNYWQNNFNKLNNMSPDEFGKHLIKCTNNPTDGTCMGAYGGPILPYTALGGFLADDQLASLSNNSVNYLVSKALILTVPINNYNDKEKPGKALAWEKRFLEHMKEQEKLENIEIAYNAERGVEDEINRETTEDLPTIAVSYIMMFTYITLALSSFMPNCKKMMLESKITVGLCGVILVMVSVGCAIGLCSYCGLEATLFVLEVMPFLVLAVGVDNIFIIVQTYQREKQFKTEEIDDFVARIIGKTTPTLLVSTVSEAVCFFLGAMSDMPAIYTFAIYTGAALLINFCLQMTCFIVIIYLDAKRSFNLRYDVLCCVKASKLEVTDDKDPDCGLLYKFFANIYAPFLLKTPVKTLVILLFSGLVFTSGSFIPNIDIGLEQQLSMPRGSYVTKYFDYLNEYLSIGAPVYFVIKDGYNYSDIASQNALCAAFGCNRDSMLSQIFSASQITNVSLLASGANSWLGAYNQWITDTDEETTACCRLWPNGTYIDSHDYYEINAGRTCLNDSMIQLTDGSKRAKPEYFTSYIKEFLEDIPHYKPTDHNLIACPEAGKPAYGQAVQLINQTDGSFRVGATYLMAYHTILRKSPDFTNGLRQIRKLIDEYNAYLKNQTGTDAEVFAYSIFYVYYEQYLTMWENTMRSLGICLVAVFIVMEVLTGLRVWLSLLTMLTIFMILVNMIGMMSWWGIQLNAITLVNLIMSIGISVEFCSHLSHAFVYSLESDKDRRVVDALSNIGSSVFSGITMTKLVGIIVLAFAHSELFRMFFFRMCLGMVVFGGLHGFIFLPVLLSVVGPGVNNYLLQDKIRKETSHIRPSPTQETSHIRPSPT